MQSPALVTDEKVLILTGLLDAVGDVSTSATRNLGLLTDHWKPEFARKEIDFEAAKVIADEWIRPMDTSSTTPPTPGDFIRAAKMARSSSTGPDGIPFSAWAASGSTGGDTLAEMDRLARCGHYLPPAFNASIWIFIPKTSEDMATKGQVHPGETRPLTVKNSDNKTIASAWLFKLQLPYAARVSKAQNGSVPERQFLQNVVDLDTHARIHGMPDPAHHLPCFLFWDMAAAFPSVSHDWLFCCNDSAYQQVS